MTCCTLDPLKPAAEGAPAHSLLNPPMACYVDPSWACCSPARLDAGCRRAARNNSPVGEMGAECGGGELTDWIPPRLCVKEALPLCPWCPALGKLWSHGDKYMHNILNHIVLLPERVGRDPCAFRDPCKQVHIYIHASKMWMYFLLCIKYLSLNALVCASLRPCSMALLFCKCSCRIAEQSESRGQEAGSGLFKSHKKTIRR